MLRARRFTAIAAPLAALLLSACGINSIPTAEEEVKGRWADVENNYQRRADLIPNLVETVKGYASHEKETFDAVIKARNQAQAASGPHDQAVAEQQLTGAVGRLLALGEAYPDLKASANFQQLQQDLGNVEDKLAAARRFFNNAVGEFNAAIQAFPAVFFAPQMGFSPREFFDVGEETRAQIEVAPTVKF